jgi:hypothetical protein
MRKLAAAFLFVPITLVTVACARPPEQQMLTQFFRAARFRDNATTARMAVAELSPRDQGTVESFSITSIGAERREPLSFKALFEAEAKARVDEEEFLKRKIEYQTANIKTIEEVLKLERDPKARMTPAQTKVKAEWDKWREEINAHQRAVSQARTAITLATTPAAVSLDQPGQPKLDPQAFEGEMVYKDVVVAAQMKTPDGQDVEKTLTITLGRVVGSQGGTAREGRPIITRIAGL